jgi:hypothetical protein
MGGGEAIITSEVMLCATRRNNFEPNDKTSEQGKRRERENDLPSSHGRV